MDTSNWRPTQGTEPTMDTSDWRSQLQPDSRQRIVNKIMDTLKRHLPVTGQEGLLELRKIAQRFEEKIYTAATSQSDYLRKISLKMLAMENKSQNTMVNPMQSNPGGPSNKPIDSASLDSTAQTGQPSGDDWQEEVYQKIKQMEESYLPELNEMYQKIATKLQQHDSLPQQLKPDQLDKLKMFKTMLERIIAFLQVSKANILPNFKEKIGAYEKQIINFISTNRPRKTMSSLQTGHLPPPHMHSISQPQSQLTQVLQQQKQLYQSQRALPDSSSTSLDSTAQTGQPSGDDWQEEVYQNIKQMKESYLPELNEMYQKIATKLQQHDSLPQQLKPDQLDKLKMFKTMLERIIAFLQVSKANILPNFKEKIGAYEKQIINFIKYK